MVHLAPAEVVAPWVRRLLAPNPGLMTGAGTNTYLLGDGPVGVVDPGPDDDRHLQAIMEATGGHIGWVLATHTHVDHSPLAARLAALTGAEVLGFGPAPTFPAHVHRVADPDSGGTHVIGGAESHDATFAPHRRLVDGDRVRIGPMELEAVHTPGHCSNHLCFEVAGTGLLLSGDHVMGGSTVVIAPPDGDMADYLDSLERVRARHPTRIGPGHGPMLDDPAAVLEGYLVHRQAREASILDALAVAGAGGVDVPTIVAALYADVPLALHPVAAFSVWAHLRKLVDEGRAEGADPDDRGAPWWVAGGRRGG